jgi:hypothetical protein
VRLVFDWTLLGVWSRSVYLVGGEQHVYCALHAHAVKRSALYAGAHALHSRTQYLRCFPHCNPPPGLRLGIRLRLVSGRFQLDARTRLVLVWLRLAALDPDPSSYFPNSLSRQLGE